MKHWIYLSILLLFSLQLRAQFSGYITGNYAGVNSLLYQPANVAESPYQWDINILSTRALVFGDDLLPNYGILYGLQTGGIGRVGDLLDIQNAEAQLLGIVQFPSVLYSINDRSGVALSMHMRAISEQKFSSFLLPEVLQLDFEEEIIGTTFENSLARLFINSWVEYNATYGHRIWKNEQHKLTGGLSFKLLQGVGSAKIELNELSFTLQDATSLADFNATVNILYNSEVDRIIAGEEVKLLGRTGYGFDLGTTYEYRSPSKKDAPYTLKLGFSALDLGRMAYRSSKSSVQADLSINNLSLDRFQGVRSISDFVDTLDAIFDLEEKEADRYIIRLPATFLFHADYAIHRDFYVHANFRYTLLKFTFDTENLDNLYQFSITPRYENSRFGVYLPFTYNRITLFDTGLALRWKYITLGSGNILSRWFKDSNEVAQDIFLVLKVPLLKKESDPE